MKRYLPVFALVVGLVLTIVASLEVKKALEHDATHEFAVTSDQVTLKIQERLAAYALTLKGGAGFFAASGSVNRHEWKAYVEKLRAQDSVPGVQGIGFSQIVPPQQLADHIAGVRAEGFPDYAVRPAGERAIYTSIVFLEPFRDRNLRAFGFDMFSEPVRRAAMERARDTGAPALSGKVELVQETATDVQAGTLMYVPVYRNGASIDTIEQRRTALIGWTYSPYRMKDLVEGILTDWEAGESGSVGLQIYDGLETKADSLLYDSRPSLTTEIDPLFYQQRTVDFNGQHWLLTFAAAPGVIPINYGSAWATLTAGIALSSLLCGLMLSLARTQIRAREIAETLTEEVRRSADLLRESELRWKFALEGAGDGVWDWNVPQSKVFFSPGWKEMLGFATDEIGDGLDEWSKRVHPDDLERVMADVRAHLDGTTALYINEHRVSCKDGSWKWILARGLIVARDAAGKPLRMVGTQSDITERKLAEKAQHDHREWLEREVASRTEALTAAKDAAEAANRAKSAFLSTMSHELRTPMNAIMGMTELALRRCTDAKQADQLTKVMAASDHLLHVINDILDISRIEAERLTLKNVNFSLTDVLENLVSLIDKRATDKGLKFLVDLRSGLPMRRFNGDPTRLGQILLNLAGNAIKFTEQGTITVRAKLVEDNPHDVLLRWEIADTGIGIDAEAQKRLFRAFEQADNSMTRKYGGSGLGLAICKRLVGVMGGEIGVESTPGQGSTFWFTVRLGAASAAMPTSNLVSRAAEQALKTRYAGARVLLADDEPINRQVSRGLIEDVGLIVDLAENGRQAMELATQNPYALILMDMQMPVMNGVEATQAIRALPGYAQTPILAMTANAFDEDRQICIDAGMNEHLAKPVNPQKLYETLLGWLEKRSSRSFA